MTPDKDKFEGIDWGNVKLIEDGSGSVRLVATKVPLMIREFMDEAEIGPEYDEVPRSIESQFSVFEEEVDELKIEYMGWLANMTEGVNSTELGTEGRRAMLAEELADVRVTIDILAEMLDIDIEAAEGMKMEYNLEKTSDKDGSGKVTDDADVEKPDFTEVVR